MRFAALLFTALLTLGMPSTGVAASESAGHADAGIATLRRLLNQPEGGIDLARAKVAIDRIVDPTIDVEGTLKVLDQWAEKMRARFPPGASNKTRIDLLVSTLYEPGPWNDYQPFGYDYSDPFGADPASTLLSNYLTKRKGQCVAMPIAIVALGQKLGLPVTMTTAPYHVMVKYGDEEIGQWTNLEATSGRFYADSRYEQAMRIPQEAIEHGTFLRPYTQRESVALFATATLLPQLRQKRQPEQMLQVADLVLSANPTDAVAMTFKGDAYYLLIEQRFKSKYPLASQIPEAEQAQYKDFSRQNLEWYAKAEALGWRQWTAADRARYLDHFVSQKAKHEATPMPKETK